jgi:SPFH domain/Band 7 family protein
MDTRDMDEGFGQARRPGRRPKTQINISPAKLMAVVIVVVLIGFVGIAAMSGNLGFKVIDAQQVGVKVNYVTGNKEVMITPGVKIYLPFLENVFTLDKTPQKFVMAGNRSTGDNRASQLTVRAADGSNFWFDTLEIQYELIPGKADVVLEDSGFGNSYKRDWVRAYSRSVLRDEFGRFDAVGVADPANLQLAGTASTDRLNELLEPHGIRIVQIVTETPSFDPAYEQAIEDRKVADQEVERLEVERSKLLQQRERKLAAVDKVKEVERTQLQGDLVRLLKESEKEQIRVEKSADAYRVEREAEGLAARDRMVFEAEGLTAKYTKEAEGLIARAEALEKRGSVVVREALIEKLRRVRFTLIPYSKDPTPKRLEHVDSRNPHHEGADQ